MQEAGRLHLRRCCFELHGWEGWRLQAGDHRQRQSVCNHRIRHRSAEGLTLETAHWPGSAAVPRRRWAQIIIHKSSLHTHPLRRSFYPFPLLSVLLYANHAAGSVCCISREVGSQGRVNILQDSTESLGYDYLHYTLAHFLPIHR